MTGTFDKLTTLAAGADCMNIESLRGLAQLAADLGYTAVVRIEDCGYTSVRIYGAEGFSFPEDNAVDRSDPTIYLEDDPMGGWIEYEVFYPHTTGGHYGWPTPPELIEALAFQGDWSEAS